MESEWSTCCVYMLSDTANQAIELISQAHTKFNVKFITNVILHTYSNVIDNKNLYMAYVPKCVFDELVASGKALYSLVLSKNQYNAVTIENSTIILPINFQEFILLTDDFSLYMYYKLKI